MLPRVRPCLAHSFRPSFNLLLRSYHTHFPKLRVVRTSDVGRKETRTHHISFAAGLAHALISLTCDRNVEIWKARSGWPSESKTILETEQWFEKIHLSRATFSCRVHAPRPNFIRHSSCLLRFCDKSGCQCCASVQHELKRCNLCNLRLKPDTGNHPPSLQATQQGQTCALGQ